MKRARRDWIGCGAIALLWVSCLTPASLGGSNLTSFDVYLYNGLYGTCHAEGGWGWKTKDSIKGYTLIMTNVPCTGIRAGFTNAYPRGYSAPSGYVLESDAGILAVQTGTTTNGWKWNSELYETGVNMKCGLLSTYSPYPKYWDEDRNDGITTNVLDLSCGNTDCINCGKVAGSPIVTRDQVEVEIPLGSANTNLAADSAGRLSFYSPVLTSNLAIRATLVYKSVEIGSRMPVNVIRDGNGWITDVVSSQYVARVTNVTDGFKIMVYTNQAAGTPVSTTTISQPGGGIPVVVQLESDELTGFIKEYQPVTVTGGHEGLALIEKNASGEVLRRWITATWTNDGEVLEMEECHDGGVDGGGVVSRHITAYGQYPGGNGEPLWRKLRTEDGFGDVARTNTWGYDETGRVVLAVSSDGGWTRTVYENEDLNSRVSQTITPWLNASPDAWTDAAQCRIVYSDQSNSLSGAISSKYETETTVIAGQTNRITVTISTRSTNTASVITQTNIVFVGTNGALTTSTLFDPQGYPFVTCKPDGSITSNRISTIWQWTNGAYSGRSAKVEEYFAGDANALNGQRTKTVTDMLTGALVKRQTWLIVNGETLLTTDEKTLAVDTQWRSVMSLSLNGTNETVYGCCGVMQTVDAEGIVTDYTYDDLKRQVTVTRAGVVSSNVYDAASRVVATYRFPEGGEPILVSSNTYNDVGELIATTDALGNTTSSSNWVDAVNGWTYQRTTNPDGACSCQQSYRDGQLYRTFGTAVHGVEYSHSILSDGTLVNRQTKLDENNNPTAEWTETYTDMAGRAFKTVRSGDVTVNQSFYNSKGQMWKQVDADGVATLQAYNDSGEVVTQAIDLDKNDQIDYAGPDRINSHQTLVTTNNGEHVQRSVSLTWTTVGDTNATVMAVTDSVPGGRRTWQIANGLTNSSETVVDRFHAAKTVIGTAPDGSQSISLYTNGLLMASIRKDSEGTQLASTTYLHDDLGRQTGSTDGRGVSSLNSYNVAGQLIAATNAVGTADQQVTSFHFDNRGRQVAVELPDGTSKYTAYLPTGETATNWGSQTYPVAFSYDYAGRMKTMTTWTNFASNAGAAVTTWNYNPTNGMLVFKQYYDGQGPSYTYTDAGQLKTRQWARGVLTTYDYNNAKDLVSVGYSDATPSVTNTFDRLGRRVTSASAVDSIGYLYNAAGQLTNETHSAGLLAGIGVETRYDALSRRTSVSAGSEESVLSFADYSYDLASRLQVVGDASGHSATYAYLPGSDLVSNTVFTTGENLKMTTTKTFDNLGRLTEIRNRDQDGATLSSHVYQYNPANQRIKAVLADGTYWDYSYDFLGQVTNGVRRWAADDRIVAGQDFGYAFDDIGNRKQTTGGGSNAVSVYTANLLNQYEQRTVPGLIEIRGSVASNATVTINNLPTLRQGEYFYKDLPVSNEFSAVLADVKIVAALKNAGSNQQDIVTQQSGKKFVARTPEVFTHDADGNLISDGRWTYTWDGENRLNAMQTASNVLTTIVTNVRLEFAYDTQSRRIGKSVFTNDSGSWVQTSDSRFLYDGWNLLSEICHPSSGMQQTRTNAFVWGLDLSGTAQGAGGIGGLLWNLKSSISNTSCAFFAYDGNGNVSALVDASTGLTAAKYEYSPFGETLRSSGAMAQANPFMFSTKYFDSETGLIYYGFRYYQPDTGRWASRDPIGEMASENLYSFIDNAPIDDIDLLGNVAYGFRRSLSDGPYKMRDYEPSYSVTLWIELPHQNTWPAAARRVWQLNHWTDTGEGVNSAGSVIPINRSGYITDNFESTRATGGRRVSLGRVPDMMSGVAPTPSGVTICLLSHTVEKKVGWNTEVGPLLNTGTYGNTGGPPLNPGDVLSMHSMREDAAAALTYSYLYINNKDCKCQRYWASLVTATAPINTIVERLDVPGIRTWEEVY